MPANVKRIAIIVAAAALAITPGAAAAKKPEKAKDRSAKVERKAGSAQQRCRDERKGLGAPEFNAKYGKPRTKGSAKAKAKAARAAFGRCVSQTAKRLRAEREAAEADEGEDPDDLEDEDLESGDDFDHDEDFDGDDDLLADDFDDDADKAASDED